MSGKRIALQQAAEIIRDGSSLTFSGSPSGGAPSRWSSNRFDEETGEIYLDTCHAGNTPEQIRDMCQFDLDISRASGETLPPTRAELHYIHDVLDPEQIFIPKVKQKGS